MRVLYRSARRAMHQTLVADFSIADAYRSVLEGAPMPYRRPLLTLTTAIWRVSRGLFGLRAGLWVAVVAASALALPRAFGEAMRLHPEAYRWEGDPGARIVLLRTVVANEPRIARWLGEKHGAPAAMLKRDPKAKRRAGGLAFLFTLAGRYFGLNFRSLRALIGVASAPAIRSEFSALVPYWLALMARESVEIAWAAMWAENFLARRKLTHLYFSMNHAMENGFRFGLPGVPSAYVEHGFPRRDIPPLDCRQYVYSEGYADYLRAFESALEIETIGLAYFPKLAIVPTRTIVVATLQDWAGFKICDVEKTFNRALAEARKNGWRLVFRTRTYGTDAFAQHLDGPWDEISEAAHESFTECLERTRPAMVWTTWSTAVLDAAACGIAAFAFVTPRLNDHFVTDLEAFAVRVMPDGAGYGQLAERLARAA